MTARQVHPSDNSEAPDLRIVPLSSLIEHEFNDAQRTEPLAQRLAAEGQLKNPPIVAPLEDDELGRFVVLDGANRTMALSRLGYPHALVQVVPYTNPPVTLTTWHHLICGIEVDTYLACLREVDGLETVPMDPLHARAGLARRELLAYTVCADGRVIAAQTPSRTLHEQNDLLNAMVDTYKTRGRLYRAATDNLAEAQRLYPDLTGLMVFPSYTAAEVMALARDDELLPPGLTRHLIQGRVLRINYPLDELRSEDSLDAKNERLQAWIKRKMGAKEIRFYGESTYLFDE